MRKKTMSEIFRKIKEDVTDKKFLADIKLSKKKMLEVLSKSDWNESFSTCAGEETFTCREALAMCRNSLDALSDEPAGGWLRLLYEHTIRALYPDQDRSDFMVLDESRYYAGIRFLYAVLRCVFAYEQQHPSGTPISTIDNLSLADIEHCPARDEYKRYLKLYEELYLYEFMRIGGEIMPYKLLDHIAGVHALAMHIAKQIAKKGVPIDLALMSGAAACHDIGKFGCRDSENARVPYLHYYYTDQCLKRFEMPATAHIAANHSAWDLELESLSVESLLLIYSDFRVKDERKEDGRMESRIFTLTESFDVILGKLDNVDERKKQRYRKVYAKIKDFENYLLGLGTDVNFGSGDLRIPKAKNPAIMDSDEIIEKIKALAIEHNIKVMNIFNNESAFGSLLEEARSQTQWKPIRAYINIFDEYSTHMNQKQKAMTLQFMYETLMHREGDIRRQAAALMGKMIAGFDEEYRKELPNDVVLPDLETTSASLWEKYLDAVIFPDHKVTEQHKRWIGYTLRLLIDSIFEHCHENEKKCYLERLLSYYKDADVDDATAFVLLDSMRHIPLELCTEQEIEALVGFAFRLWPRQPAEIKVAVLTFADHITKNHGDAISAACADAILSVADEQEEDAPSIAYLKTKIRLNMGKMCEEPGMYAGILSRGKRSVSELFLENLKINTPWILKIINIEFLLKLSGSANRETLLHIATHFSNLVKVSERVTVRHRAGMGLVAIIERLQIDERNEIVIELTKGLEIGEYQVSKYIPDYLGELALYLHPNELDELLSDLRRLQNSVNDRVSSVTLNTLGVIVQKYASYRGRFQESTDKYERRRRLILGMLLSGLANYRETVSQEAFYVIGKHFFAAQDLSQDEKYLIFESIYKKTLLLLSDRKEVELSFFNNAAVLNDIYRFISDYLMDHAAFAIKEPDKIAFFPGTFDPFSLSHKGIVAAVRDLGFEVYLALDEFSWSKKTQPRMIRKQIVTMSVADESNVYVFPDDIPVNIANPSDLKMLADIWPARKVYMTVGSDVVANASSYKAAASENSIHHFNHIIFRRVSERAGGADTRQGEFPKQYEKIQGDIIELALLPHLEDISSTQIRENIDLNRDISNLIDPVVQNFIYENSLYLREPLYKNILRGKRIVIASEEKNGGRRLILRDGAADNAPIAMCAYKELRSADIYGELQNQEASTYIREQASGKIVLISQICFSKETTVREPVQLLLTEVLSECLKQDFTYAVCEGTQDAEIIGVLERQGFEKLVFSAGSRAGESLEKDRRDGADAEAYQGKVLYAVDMKFPVVLLKNMETNIKAPLNESKRVIAVIDDAHRELQRALTALYPGSLVLSISSDILHNKLVNMIAQENGVSPEPSAIRQVGPLMCVPFGEMLKGMAAPNTVTKSLHTEKVFDGRLDKFKIEEFPFYSPIINQIRTIKSFNRPVILLDDFMHKGYRIRELDPVLKSEQVEVKKIIVGILSGRGKDLMEIQRREVDSAYYIPNLRNWFVDTSLYPFVGGDSIEAANVVRAGILPSVNQILPYVAPRFLATMPPRSVFELSMTCLKNTHRILKVLEEEYQTLFERNLTLNRLSEVISIPRMPERGHSMRYDLNVATSVCAANDIEMLTRLKSILVSR